MAAAWAKFIRDAWIAAYAPIFDLNPGLFGQKANNGVFIGQLGSCDLGSRSGYRVFKAGKPFGKQANVLTNLVNVDSNTRIAVAMDKYTALLVTDDLGNTIFCA
ncbi:MAG: hypothetical protein ABL933_07840 [Methyloglobulus sp.]